MQITLDTHRFIKFLEEKKHFTHEQAEILVEAAVEYTNTVGKLDLSMQKKISLFNFEALSWHRRLHAREF